MGNHFVLMGVDVNFLKAGALVLVSAIAGCGNEPPKCSDPNTLKLIRSIFVDQLGGAPGASNNDLTAIIKIEYPRATGYDEKIKRYSCDARLTVNDDIKYEATYESQVGDDGDHMVILNGMSKRDQLVLATALSAGLSKSHAAPALDVAKKPEIGTTPVNIYGKWAGSLEGEGEMTIKQGANGPEVSIGVGAPNCGGSIEGIAVASGNSLKLTKTDDGQICTLTIDFKGAQAVIDEDNCSYYHGAACGFSGTLARIK